MKRLTAILMSMMMLTAIPALPAGAVKHTFSGDLTMEHSEDIAEQYQNLYVLGEDGVYYGAESYPIRILEEYIPNGGTVDSVNVLQALARLHPDAKFAVDV